MSYLIRDVFDRVVIPKRVLYKGHLSNITKLDDKCIIKKYKVISDMNYINKVILAIGIHPNAHPVTKEFCLPSYIKELPLNQESIDLLEKTMELYNLDNCFDFFGDFTVDRPLSSRYIH